MKHRSTPLAFATLALLAASLAACGSKAPDNASVSVPLPLPAESGTTATTAAPDASTATAPAAPATAIPAATDEIWKALDRQGADLQSAIDNGAWKDVPAKADAIRDLTSALPAHASKLAPDAQAKLQQDVGFVAAYAAKLDAAANAGDAAGAKANFKKLNDVLGGITRFP